jgi:hypothetical protein
MPDPELGSPSRSEALMRSPLAPSRIVLLAATLAACNASSLTAPVDRSKLLACPITASPSATPVDTIGYDTALPPAPVVSDLRAEEARAVCSTRVSPFIGQPGRRYDAQSEAMTGR